MDSVFHFMSELGDPEALSEMARWLEVMAARWATE